MGCRWKNPQRWMSFTKRSGLFATYTRETKEQNFEEGGVEMHPWNSNFIFFFFLVVLGNVCVCQSISLFFWCFYQIHAKCSWFQPWNANLSCTALAASRKTKNTYVMMFLEHFQMPLDDDSRGFFPLLSKIVLISQAHFGQNVWTCI